MQTSEIVHQLKAVLPKFTDDFSDSVNITNIVVNGNNVTFTTDGNHHLKDNNTFLICNVKNYYEITSLKRYNNIAIALANSHHNITKDQSSIEMTGASDAKYNGTKTLSKTDIVFNVASKVVNNDDTLTITTTESNPFIVNANYKIDINGNLIAIKSIVNSTTFIVDNFMGIANDSILTQISLKSSLHLFFYQVDETANANPTGSIKLLETRNFGYKIKKNYKFNWTICNSFF
jgi:hypothetical protein